MFNDSKKQNLQNSINEIKGYVTFYQNNLDSLQKKVQDMQKRKSVVPDILQKQILNFNFLIKECENDIAKLTKELNI